MQSEQAHWASQLRAIPTTFYEALDRENDRVMRHRPAPGEWSAIEVMGHMIDKFHHWSKRAERVLLEEQPLLPGYDQDAEVSKHDYQHADPAALYERLNQRCEHFAHLVETFPTSALQRQGQHGEMGTITLRQCIELPLASASEHMEQLRAAQAAASAGS